MASVDERYFGPLDDGDAATLAAQLRAGEEPLPDKLLATRGAAGGPEPDPDPRVASDPSTPAREAKEANGNG